LEKFRFVPDPVDQAAQTVSGLVEQRLGGVQVTPVQRTDRVR
jgi:hypothetical protein